MVLDTFTLIGLHSGGGCTFSVLTSDLTYGTTRSSIKVEVCAIAHRLSNLYKLLVYHRNVPAGIGPNFCTSTTTNCHHQHRPAPGINSSH